MDRTEQNCLNIQRQRIFPKAMTNPNYRPKTLIEHKQNNTNNKKTKKNHLISKSLKTEGQEKILTLIRKKKSTLPRESQG